MSGIPTNNFDANIVLPHLAENKRVDLPLQHFFQCDSLVEDRSDCFRELSMAQMEDNAGLHTIPSLQPAHCTLITCSTCQIARFSSFLPMFSLLSSCLIARFFFLLWSMCALSFTNTGNDNVPVFFLVGAYSSSGGVDFVLAWRDDAATPCIPQCPHYCHNATTTIASPPPQIYSSFTTTTHLFCLPTRC